MTPANPVEMATRQQASPGTRVLIEVLVEFFTLKFSIDTQRASQVTTAWKNNAMATISSLYTT